MATTKRSSYRYRMLWYMLASNFLAICSLAQPAGVGLDPTKRLSQYTVDTWTYAEGLSSNSIIDCYYSRDGYLWFASYDGLVRFDGLHFTIYDKSNTPAFKTNGLLEIYEDEVGMWIGTNGGGLILRQGEKFSHIPSGPALKGNVVTAIEGDGDGGYWLGSRLGLVHYQDSVFKPTEHPLLGKANVYDLARDAEGRLWVATAGSGVFYLEDNTFHQLTEDLGTLPSKSARVLYPEADGSMWIGLDVGFALWDGEVKDQVGVEDGLPSNFVNTFLRDPRGTFWVGTDEGLVRYNPNTREVEVLDPALLSHNTIQSIISDHEGSLWLGTYRGGINRLKDGKFTNFGVPEGLPSEVVNVTLPVDDGVWIGTDYGIGRLSGQQITPYLLGNNAEENRVRDIIQDSQGRIWLCTYQGLVLWDKGRIIQKVDTDHGLSNNRVRTAAEDQDGNIWIGTANGLNRLAPDGTITQWGQEEGLQNDFIMSLLVGRDNSLWIGTNGGGVFHLEGGEFKAITSRQGLANDVVFQITEDSDGTLWVGTSGGLSVIRNGKASTLGLTEGLVANAVFQVVEDRFDDYWMTTDKGVLRVNKQELRGLVRGDLDAIQKVKLYSVADGMRARETTGASHMGMDAQGRLWVPTLDGVTLIDPQEISPNLNVPEVVIEEVRVNQSLQYGSTIKVPKGQNRIEIHYTALTFLASEEVNFEYKLEGFDEDWVEVGDSRLAIYTNLPPGNYTFRVIAGNSDDYWNKEGATLHLEKEARFVETIYFYIILMILVLGTGLVLYYVRLTNLNSRNQQLTAMVEERTQNIKRQSEDIRKQAEELETINSIVQTINQEYELDRVLEALIHEALKLFPQSERAAFLVYNEEERDYAFKATRGIGHEDFRSLRLSPQEAFSTFGGDYQEVEEGVFIVKTFHDVIGKLVLKDVRSSLVMTIKRGDFPEGFLFLLNTSNHRAFDKSDSARLKRFRDHALSAYSKAKVLQDLEIQKRKLELYFQNMNDSVQYARRIQEALLPREQVQKKIFPESFIFYRPKDVVSGDFYWVAEHNGLKIIAAVDRTGHGVPGAFMSVLGNSLLNQIVNERGITSPGLILEELHRMTRITLQQSSKDALSHDGMDVALCQVNTKTNKLIFAGAKRPLYFFRENQLHVIKGDKFSIGGLPHEEEEVGFAEHNLPLDGIQAMYLFSDGYYDQFNKETGKKFMVSRFKNMLRNIHAMPVADQKTIVAKRIIEWMGKQDQVDDMLVIGVKF